MCIRDRYSTYALALVDHGHFESAREVLHEALDREPDQTPLRLLLARALLGAQHLDETELDQWRQAIAEKLEL